MERVVVRGLYKRFGKTKVLEGIDLTVGEGTVVAILGPNASGKTTLIKCILGLVVPNRGKIVVMGEDIRSGVEYRRYIGYMPQIAKFPENLTVRELLNLVKDVRDQPSKEEYYIDLFGLHPFLDRPLGVLSGGTRQKVNATLAFMFGSDILILDEPTVGFDPVASTHFKDEVLRLKDEGRTVLFTSHIMGEVEEMADRVVFLLNGKIYFDGTPNEFKVKTGEKTLERAIAKLMKEARVEEGV
ncbi:MAG: ABC transporter ATP-binding protein [Thermotogae bacterium]|nr:ABC transporter ATP-binding protein [Thermotogota bacterium]